MIISAFWFLNKQQKFKDREFPNHFLPLLYDPDTNQVLVKHVGMYTYKLIKRKKMRWEDFNALANDMFAYFCKYTDVDNVEFNNCLDVVFRCFDPVAYGLERLQPQMFFELRNLEVDSVYDFIVKYAAGEKVMIVFNESKKDRKQIVIDSKIIHKCSEEFTSRLKEQKDIIQIIYYVGCYHLIMERTDYDVQCELDWFNSHESDRCK